ncbi:putative bifunctional diguanylate cyclase/phosphodiesterase [Blastococcus sp. PRF04-17]|uniref:putative bifunctional diguanylate cyclase/phosphodiesterase n=1 Tax=Blastococcus sp. PRF04-17 TaxID=2933797 RepID=UPI001FF2DA34|nr:GGDEF domain-containing phosphodiesterase [Blastococcus sp. PRF04-17]UOY01462.1 EAL domain-containing protein [Blastococcus sp. PRF04-17]
MDPRRWWLLAAVAPVAVACAVAVGDPALRLVGDLGVVLAGLIASAVLWIVGGRRSQRRNWRLLAVAPLLPAAGTVLSAALDPADALELVVLRWVPTVPGYVLAVVAILSLVDRQRLRSGGLRLAVELCLFLTACVVAVQLLVIGPSGSWTHLALAEQLVLGAAVVATSATMAAALTLLGVIEVRRQRMALVLLTGAVLLTTGRGLATRALLTDMAGAVDLSRFLVAAGLGLLAAAVLVDPGPDPDSTTVPVPGRSTALGQLLPHFAMVVALVIIGFVAAAGYTPTLVSVVGGSVCILLTAVHRWVTVRDAGRMALRLRRSEAYFRSLVRSSGDAIVILDDALRITWASPALDRALGTAAADLVGRPLLDVVHPEDVAPLTGALPVAAPRTEAPRTEAPRAETPDAHVDHAGLLLLRLQDAAGVWRYLEAGISDLRDDPDVGAVVLHCRDMTERHARELALQGIAYTDPMTGLPNRAGVLKTLEAELAQAGSGASTLLLIALDGLASARENAGRENVTRVVAEIGRRLRATVRGEDTVARMGGGAFAVLTDGADADADRLAARCLSVVEQPIMTPNGLVELTAGVGLAPLEPGVGVDELLARADLAVRAAHARGEGCVARYSPAIGEAAARQERLRTDLQGASARGEMFLLTQPIVSLSEERITGLEAQLHWRHPDLGEIAPAEFLALAERNGLLADVVRWALAEATSVAAALPAYGAPLRIGFKVPAGYAATGTLVADVEHALTTSGLAPERLVLQVTSETATTGDDRTGLDITSLRLMGVHVALDGFGSGSSALAHLTQLPIDIVRLDRSLITRIDRDPQSRALCESIAGIARALGLDVVAEGVETPAQLAALAGFGCGFAQGFLISRPIPPAQVEPLLAAGAGALLPSFVSRV